MKHRVVTVFVLIATLLLSTSLVPATAMQPEGPALVQIVWQDPGDLDYVEALGVPVYALLTDDGEPYLLAGASAKEIEALQAQGLAVTLLDADLRGATYYLAYLMPGRARPDWNAYGQLLLDDGTQVLLRATPQDAERLTEAGVELNAVTLTPKPLRPAQLEGGFPAVIDPDPLIQNMIDQVSSTDVYSYTGDLSGEWPVWVGGEWYTITSRHTYSGQPIQKATQYVGEHLGNLGLDVEYHEWGGPTYPNVIGELPGLTNPDDIFIIGGHLDDVSGSPGADDNASGSVAALIAADILSQYEWGCTLRFALWTGEEQGLNGSYAYAERSFGLGENIVGYLNLDMIAWNTPSSSPGIDLRYSSSMPPTYELAQLFADVVSAYGMNLIPEIGTGGSGGSDHSSFWNYGYTAILAIEDNGDFNPYYHTSQDTLAHLDIPYYTEFVKASVGTFAHMSGCLIPSGIGYLDGTVTATSGGAPIPDATLTIYDDAGHVFSALTDMDGYYTRTLVADTYTVTAEAYGYLPAMATGVVVTTDTVTTQDFSLDTAPTYIVSGTVTEQGTGIPLFAQVEFQGSPETVWTDPATGFYQATLPQGEYTMLVTAAGHRPQERPIVLDHDQTQDFALELLPCILLVDDDNDAPDVLPYYTAALDNLGYDYDIASSEHPSLGELAGYEMVIWFSGDKYGGSAGPNGTDETNLAAYLDGGGKLFLSSQDYLYDFDLTPFGQNYLGIGSYTSDDGDATTKYGVAGDPIGGGLGPYPLSYPSGFTDWGDIVNAGTGASVAFRSNPSGGNNLDVDKDGGAWQTVFFGTSWVPIYNYNAANGEELLQRIIDWFGGCECQPVSGTAMEWTPVTPTAGEEVTFTGTVAAGDLPVVYDWDFGDGQAGSGQIVAHTYAAEGDYTVNLTATNACGQEATSDTITVLPPPCEPVEVLEVISTTAGCEATFAAELTGDAPYTYTWDFGAWGSSDEMTPTVDFGLSGTYAYTLTVLNCAGTYSHTVTGAVTVACEPPCEPVEVITVTAEVSACVVAFDAELGGTPPYTYAWDFGTFGLSTVPTPTLDFGASGTYPYTLTASNCSTAYSDTMTGTVAVECAAPTWYIYLPLVLRRG